MVVIIWRQMNETIIGDGNDTDTMTDYFDKGRVVLFEDHILYAKARERAESK